MDSRRSWLSVPFPLLLGVTLVAAGLAGLRPAAGAGADPNGRLVVAQNGDVTTVDPNADTVVGNHDVIDNMFDVLLGRNLDGKYVPSLAVSWQFIDPILGAI